MTAEASTSRIDVDIPQLSISIDAVDNLYNDQILKVERRARELMILSKETIDTRYKEVCDLTRKISQYQSELKKMIEDANDKLEKLKDFNVFNDSINSVNG